MELQLICPISRCYVLSLIEFQTVQFNKSRYGILAAHATLYNRVQDFSRQKTIYHSTLGSHRSLATLRVYIRCSCNESIENRHLSGARTAHTLAYIASWRSYSSETELGWFRTDRGPATTSRNGQFSKWTSWVWARVNGRVRLGYSELTSSRANSTLIWS